jgi:hypothetical protein
VRAGEGGDEDDDGGLRRLRLVIDRAASRAIAVDLTRG